MILRKLIVVCHVFPSCYSQKGAYAETLFKCLRDSPFRSLGVSFSRLRIFIVPTVDCFFQNYEINSSRFIPKSFNLISILLNLSRIFGYFSRKVWSSNDTLHIANNFYSGVYACSMSRLTSSNYIYLEHSSEYKRCASLDPIKLKILSIVTKESLLNFAVTEHFAKLMKNITGNPFYTLHNSIDTTFEAYSISNASTKTKRTFSSFNLLSVGSLDDNKNFQEVLKALSLLPSTYLKKISYKIIGEGQKQRDLLDQASNIRELLDFQILPPCSRDAIAQFMLNTNFLVSSSIYETFGMVLIESLSLGTPVLSKQNLSSLEILKTIGNDIGLTLWSDAQHLADILIYKMDTYQEKNKSRQIIVDSAMAKFSASAISSKLCNHISNLGVYANLK